MTEKSPITEDKQAIKFFDRMLADTISAQEDGKRLEHQYMITLSQFFVTIRDILHQDDYIQFLDNGGEED